jgi:eukaryotic-like serine/threonine-protein kinase
MPLAPGSQLGPYEITAPLGAGGMSEVYRARDRLLNRDVAIKVLPSFLSDPDRLRRFELEARAEAALNHPNILAVFQMGTYEKVPYLVTELLEGETLRAQLLLGAIPIRKAVEYAQQIARGLSTAHEKGIIHRDLKPENLFVTHDGRVKILDFGLAKLMRNDEGGPSETQSFLSQTEPGTLLGTVGYMSPEQVRGQQLDTRSDIFSFGVILFEMLCGKNAFLRSTPADTMSALLREEVPEVLTVSGAVSPGLDRVLRHCLEKEPKERFQSVRDLGFALQVVSAEETNSAVAALPLTGRVGLAAQEQALPPTWRPRLRVAAELLLLAMLVAAVFIWRRPETDFLQLNASILPPPGEGFWAQLTQPAAISPDGKFLAVISMRDGRQQLWLRRMDNLDAQPISGSEEANNPFWSPDSRSVGFFTNDRLKKFDVSGGLVTDICHVGSYGMGGSWSSRGVIVFSNFGGMLRKVSENGGSPEAIPGVSVPPDTIGQYWPAFLPDGNHFIYMNWSYSNSKGDNNTLWMSSLDGETPRRIPLTATNVLYANGYVLFSRDGDLLAQKFDLNRYELIGPALPLARHVQYDAFFNYAAFTASSNGILVYGTAGTGANSELTWIDRNGKTLGVLGEPAQFSKQVISPDAQRVAVGVRDSSQGERLWVYDVARGTRIPLTPTVVGSPYQANWSPDGKRIAYRITVGHTSAIKVRASDGSGSDQQIGGELDEVADVTNWSRDGRYLVVHTWPRETHHGLDTVQVWPLAHDPEPILRIDNASTGRLSYDGHWLAYYDENDDQVYVTPFPGPGATIAVSAAGGSDPRWRSDGKELFYIGNDRSVVAVQIRESAHEFVVVSSHALFRLSLPDNVGFYDVTSDGQRFLVNTRTHLEQAAPLTVITDWPSQFRLESKRPIPGI